jgi:hypothetical protein
MSRLKKSKIECPTCKPGAGGASLRPFTCKHCNNDSFTGPGKLPVFCESCAIKLNRCMRCGVQFYDN